MFEDELRLSDGRTLGYAQWGAPEAPAIFYCHGFPASHAEAGLVEPVLEQGHDLRVVALDRPGFGSSTFQMDRTLLDWPNDVAAAADLLGIDRFAVLGVSGGGPYALACGHVLRDRVARVGVVAGIAPLEAPGMDRASVSRMPSSRWIRRLLFAMTAQSFRKGRDDRFVKQALATMGAADRRAMTRPDTRELFVTAVRAAFAQGGRAATHEGGLYREPWGFEIGDLEIETHLWYGDLDEMVPASAGQWLADRIPGSSFVSWPQHGHLTWGDSPEAFDVFSTLRG